MSETLDPNNLPYPKYTQLDNGECEVTLYRKADGNIIKTVDREINGEHLYMVSEEIVGRYDVDDPVNHPSHYNQYTGIEVIDLTEQMNFNRGNAVKYICRAGLKSPDTEIEDLQKAVFYLKREISRLEELRRLADIAKFERLVDEQEECPICVEHDIKINTEFLES